MLEQMGYRFIGVVLTAGESSANKEYGDSYRVMQNDENLAQTEVAKAFNC